MTADPSPSPEFDREAELEFVRAVLQGDGRAMVKFEQRIQCVPRILRGLNARRGRPLDDHDVADLAQDTVVIMLNKLDQFEAWVPLEGWIYRLCYLEFLNAVRRRGRRVRRTQELIDPMQGGATADGHAFDDVHVALDKLGGAEAEAIRMKHFEGLTFQEIGDRLDMPANTAKTRYYRGLQKLQALLRSGPRGQQGEEQS